MKEKNKYFIQDGMISKFDFMDNQEFLPLPTVCSLLNDQDETYDKLAKKFVIVSKAFDLAVFELDFARNHSQSTSQECIDRIAKLSCEIIGKAKEIINGYKQDD